VLTTNLTSNGYHSPVSLAAFRAYLETKRPALIEALVRDVTAQVPSYSALFDDTPEQRIDANIGVYLAGLDDPAQLVAWTTSQLGPVMTQNLELDHILQISALYRQQFLHIGLHAVLDGVESAAEGLGKLMDLVDLRVRMFVQFYQDRLHLLETLIENALDGISVTNLEGKCVYFNTANARAMGYSHPSQAIGLDANKTFAPEEEQRMLNEIVPQVLRDGFWQGQLWGQRVDGSKFRMRNAIALLKDAQGHPSAFAGYMRDITSEYEAEQSLKRQTADLRTFYALAENAPDGVLVASIDGVMSYANTAMHALLGYGEDSVSGRQVIDHIEASEALMAEIGDQHTIRGIFGQRVERP
jgi:PAS domain S-box-containing protein